MTKTQLGHYTSTPSSGLPEKKAFALGFLKKAQARGVCGQQLVDMVKAAGFEKDAFLGPLIAGGLRIAAPIAGSILGPMAFEGAATRAAAGTLPKFIQNSFVGKNLATAADTAEENIAKGQPITRSRNWRGHVGNFGSMMGGAPVGSMLAEPLARHFDPPQQNSFPQDSNLEYNQEQY